MTRREAREAVFGLLFETDFHPSDGADGIFTVSCENREIGEDGYVRAAYFGVMQHMDELDNLIGAHAHGWKTYRMSGMSRAALRLCVWEMLYGRDIPHNVSLNEAVELVKKYDDEKARPFVNGILNAVKETIEAGGAVAGKPAVGGAEAQTAEDAGEINPEDAGEIKPEDAGEIKPEDTGEINPEDTGEIKPEDAGEIKPEDTGEIKPEDAGERAKE